MVFNSRAQFRSLSVAEQVAAYLRESICEGRWPVNGEQLPPVRQLSEQFGVSLTSAQEALRMLSEAGLVELRPRQGAFVTANMNSRAVKRDQIAVVHSYSTWEDAQASQIHRSPHPREDEGHPWWHQIVYAMEAKLSAEAGWHLVSLPLLRQYKANQPSDREPASDVAGLVERLESLEPRLAGVLCYADGFTQPLLRRLDEMALPWITFNLPDRRSVYNFVTADNVGGGRRVGECLADLDMTRVLVLTTRPLNQSSSIERVSGLFQMFIERDIATRNIEVVSCEDTSEGSGYQQTRQFLRRANQPPQAVFAIGDLLALGAIRACREAGLRVPEDVGVIGGTGLSLGEHTSPSLTVLAQPMERMGQQAASMLMEMVREDVRRMSGRRVPSPLVFRESLSVPEPIRQRLETQYQEEVETLEA